jgi:hypothetical protein
MKRIKPFESFQVHPAERKKRSTVLMAHGCCCCCCLHSVAGIAGSIWGSLRRNAPDPDTLTTAESVRAEEEIRTAHRLAVKAYWLALTLIASIALAVLTLTIRSEELLGPFLVLFFLPGGQLLASLVTALWIQIRPPARKSDSLRRLGKITLYGFLGSLIGAVGVVITLYTLFSKR